MRQHSGKPPRDGKERVKKTASPLEGKRGGKSPDDLTDTTPPPPPIGAMWVPAGYGAQGQPITVSSRKVRHASGLSTWEDGSSSRSAHHPIPHDRTPTPESSTKYKDVDSKGSHRQVATYADSFLPLHSHSRHHPELPSPSNARGCHSQSPEAMNESPVDAARETGRDRLKKEREREPQPASNMELSDFLVGEPKGSRHAPSPFPLPQAPLAVPYQQQQPPAQQSSSAQPSSGNAASQPTKKTSSTAAAKAIPASHQRPVPGPPGWYPYTPAYPAYPPPHPYQYFEAQYQLHGCKKCKASKKEKKERKEKKTPSDGSGSAKVPTDPAAELRRNLEAILREEILSAKEANGDSPGAGKDCPDKTGGADELLDASGVASSPGEYGVENGGKEKSAAVAGGGPGGSSALPTAGAADSVAANTASKVNFRIPSTGEAAKARDQTESVTREISPATISHMVDRLMSAFRNSRKTLAVPPPPSSDGLSASPSETASKHTDHGHHHHHSHQPLHPASYPPHPQYLYSVVMPPYDAWGCHSSASASSGSVFSQKLGTPQDSRKTQQLHKRKPSIPSPSSAFSSKTGGSGVSSSSCDSGPSAAAYFPPQWFCPTPYPVQWMPHHGSHPPPHFHGGPAG
ncbi:hypothetical protein DIPPA_14105 [Diplonema papillatum]|nr:hypothetical protein DIPPA_14105 [Diplonema papillatum]